MLAGAIGMLGTNGRHLAFWGRTTCTGKELRMVNVDNRGTGPRRGSGSSMWFIIGALVVAVLIIGWFFMGNNTPDGDADVNVTPEGTTTPPAAGDTNVTVTPPAASTTTTTTEPATPPAAEPAPAPAPEPAAPASGTTTDPAAPASGTTTDPAAPAGGTTTAPAPAN